MNKLFIILTLGLLLVPTLNAQPPVNRPLRIMVATNTVGNPNNWNEQQKLEAYVRSRLIASLTKHCGSLCVVVEAGIDDDEYDAILGSTWHLQNECFNCGWYMSGSAELMGKDGIVLWSDNIHSAPYSRSASASFADKVAKRLVKHLADK